LATLREPHRFSAWLTGIARQVAREHRRRRKVQSFDEQLHQACDLGPPDADAADETEHLLILVSRLPEQERLAVHAFFLNGRDAAETGRLLRLSRSGVYAVLKRACVKLARSFGCKEPPCEVNP
jgi:RNA polymerase sigma factor (sigma-70 family)